MRNDKDYLLNAYGQCYGPDAGPWNLSLKNKYLEYMFAKFFEENFVIKRGDSICNIGIGAGYWDRYLSYKLNDGTLTSIDIDSECCYQLKASLINEHNPNPVEIIHSDVMLVKGLKEAFDIVTMVGSSRLESGVYEQILEKAFSFIKYGGSMFYQSLDKEENVNDFFTLCMDNNMTVDNYLLDTAYDFKAQYWKITKN